MGSETNTPNTARVFTSEQTERILGNDKMEYDMVMVCCTAQMAVGSMGSE